MQIAYLFPGQGSQYIGMGNDLYNKYPEFKMIYDKFYELTSIDISKISFDENDSINETKYTQLAILAHSLGILEILKKHDIKVNMSAGLSLGEYSALINSGVINLEDGIKLVQKRGEYMQEYIPNGNYKMAAILGLSDKIIENTCQKIGNVYPANYNSYGNVVISGLENEVASAIEELKLQGAKAMPLNTSGPFHTKFLDKSSKLLQKELEKITFNQQEIPVVKNIDGKVYSNDDDYVDILAKHIINPVKFTKVVETMLENNIDTFVEIGPGKTLSNLVKRISKEKNVQVNILNIQDCESLEKTVKQLKGVVI